MKRSQLSSAQKKLLFTKVTHLVAAIAVVGVLFVYFFSGQNSEQVAFPVEASYSINNSLSAYNQFCQNNPDINCGDTEQFLSSPNKSQVILMETNEIDDSRLFEMSMVAVNGSDISVDVKEMNNVLEKLYEERLPDDIIDEVIIPRNKKVKKLGVPEHKPAYFGNKPVIVIVIDDMGISHKRTADIASLKAPLTASFLTYGTKLNEQIENSRKNGQEIMIHAPMEAKTVADVAPDVLTTKMTKEEIKSNLLTMIKKFKDVKGINNHMGSKLTEDYDRMKAVMEVLKEEGLFFLDSKTSPKSKAEDAAADSGIAYAHRHVFLDNNNDKAYILGQLGKTEQLARKNGYAIAIGHPKTQTYAALKEWLPKLDEKGLVIEPLSKVVNILHPNHQ